MFETLKNLLLSIRNFFSTLLDNIISFFVSIWNYICQFFSYCFDFWIEVFEFILSLGPRFFDLIITGFIALLPEESQSSVNAALSSISPYISFINSWVPLDVISSCITIYFTFLAVYITVAWVIKLIPGEG